MRFPRLEHGWSEEDLAKLSAPYKEGWLAHKEGVDNTENPYSSPRQAYSEAQWLSGWSARFNAIKHGRDRGLDQALYD